MIAKKYLAENYDCDEYLNRYEKGYYHQESYLQLVLSHSAASINSEREHLVIGHAGADGTEFCYRIHNSGLWAFYPIEQKYQKVSDSIDSLVQGWENGTITV